MSIRKTSAGETATRRFDRWPHIRELRLFYEGRTDLVPVRPPDLTPLGMFVNTPATFQEGAVLKLEFRLARSGHAIQTRAEVRFCLPGVGIGIEFINLRAEHARAIEREISSMRKRRGAAR